MADSPVDSESAQALFCGMADLLGSSQAWRTLNLKKYPTFWQFSARPERKLKKGEVPDYPTVHPFLPYIVKKKGEKPELKDEIIKNQKLIDEAFKIVKAVGVTDVGRLEKFLKEKKSWYESSVLTALKLIADIHKIDADFKKIRKAEWQDFFYVRGAKGGDTTMDNIEKLFKIANVGEKGKKSFGDINKWSPADIYFVSKDAKGYIADELTIASKNNDTKKAYDMVRLNKILNALVNGGTWGEGKIKKSSDGGELLPLSLKKVVGKAATIHKYNFKRSKTEAYLGSIAYTSLISQGGDKFPSRTNSQLANLKSAPKTSQTRDLKIYFDVGKTSGGNIKIRHTPHHTAFGVNKGVKFEIEQKGAGGRLGQFVGIDVMADKMDKGFSGCTMTGEVVRAAGTAWTQYEKALDFLNATYQVPKNLSVGKKDKIEKTSKDFQNLLKQSRHQDNKSPDFSFPVCNSKNKIVWYNIETRGLTKSDAHNILEVQKSCWRLSDFKLVKGSVDPEEESKARNIHNHQGQNLYQEYQIKRMHLSGMYFDNKVFPIIAKYFEDSFKLEDGYCNLVLQVWIEYAASRSKESGMFVVAR